MGTPRSVEVVMMKLVVVFALVAVAAASESALEKAYNEELPPTGKPKINDAEAVVAGPLLAKLRANANCAGEKCEPVPPACDPTKTGDCEKPFMAPSKITCDSISHCGPCTMHLHCGWKTKEKKCVEGGAAGPFNGTAAAGDWTMPTARRTRARCTRRALPARATRCADGAPRPTRALRDRRVG